jgi:hypothetical protein
MKMFLHKLISKKTWKTNMSATGQKAGSGSVGQKYGSSDPDPDPYKNVTDPQHCYAFLLSFTLRTTHSFLIVKLQVLTCIKGTVA